MSWVVKSISFGELICWNSRVPCKNDKFLIQQGFSCVVKGAPVYVSSIQVAVQDNPDRNNTE